jgi:cystathionine beta-lyase/cystathionine gamma-synthase
MQSATKYLNGHSDVTGGVLAGPAELINRIERARRLLGGIMDPSSAYALGRGLKTLSVRVHHQNESAFAIARHFAGDRRVSTVHYPGLPSHPSHDIASRQMTGFGGMVCLDLGGSFERAEHAFDRLKVIRRAASLGGVESLVSMPVLTSQWGYSDEQLAAAGITRGMLRLSIGLEETEELIKDLDGALA